MGLGQGRVLDDTVEVRRLVITPTKALMWCLMVEDTDVAFDVLIASCAEQEIRQQSC